MEHCGGQPNESFINNGKNGSAMTTEVGAGREKAKRQLCIALGHFFCENIFSWEKFKTGKI